MLGSVQEIFKINLKVYVGWEEHKQNKTQKSRGAWNKMRKIMEPIFVRLIYQEKVLIFISYHRKVHCMQFKVIFLPFCI